MRHRASRTALSLEKYWISSIMISVSTLQGNKAQKRRRRSGRHHRLYSFVLPHSGAVLPEYSRVRVPDDHAIADLAMYNYIEVICPCALKYVASHNIVVGFRCLLNVQ